MQCGGDGLAPYLCSTDCSLSFSSLVKSVCILQLVTCIVLNLTPT